LAMMASENNNMTMCWVWLAVTGIAIIRAVQFSLGDTVCQCIVEV
jgi:hypothetical protein